MTGIMTGFACHIRQLKPEDVKTYGVNLNDVPIEECVAVFGEDLGECLAAVVRLQTDDGKGPHLLWSDADGKGTPLEIIEAIKFQRAVGTILTSLFEHLNGLV